MISRHWGLEGLELESRSRLPKDQENDMKILFFQKSLGVFDVLLQNTKGGWNPLSEFEEICGIGTLEHPCQRQSGELLYCGCCSCLGTFWTRSWHGRSPVCHDCVDHLLNHFWPILPPESLFSRFFTKDKWFPVCLRQVMVDFTSPTRGTWSALLLKSLYPGEFALLLFTAVEGRLILQIRWNNVDFVHPWGPCCKLESAHSDSQQKGREIFNFQCWHDNCS